jgi:Kef-type K+ transport system membrane component KefB
MVAHGFGFHFAVGAFMAGLILKKEYFQSDAANGSYADTKRFIDGLAFTWVGPVFFVVLGAKLVFDWDIIVSVIPHTTVMVMSLFVAQVASAGLAARYTGGLRMPAAMMVGLGMLGRAELAFVVMDIAYVENSVFSAEAFYTLMLTAFCLNVAVPISIRLWKPFYEETARERPVLHQTLETETV